MKSGKKIGVLIVAYNAVSTLAKVLDRIPESVYEEIDEIAVFDDASKDDTYMLSVGYKEIKKLHKLQIYTNEKNLGYGGNQKRGFKYYIDKGFDAVVLLHGDGQYAPEHLKEMYTPITDGEADVVLGSRMMKKYGGALKGGMPLYKFLGNKILTAYENHSLKMNLTEFHSGYRAYSLHGLKKFNLDNMSDDFHFDTQILVKSNHVNLKIIEIPIPTFYGDEICYVNGFKYAKDIYRTVHQYKLTLKGKTIDPIYSEFYIRYPFKEYPYSSHSEILKIVNSKTNLKILEISDGNSVLVTKIRKDNKVTGAGFALQDETVSKNYEKYFQCDLNKGLPDEVMKHEFDIALLPDILEHLYNYKNLLSSLDKTIKSGGKIIFSIPNIANIYVRLNLLIGRFPYADRGLLDRNHMHFFTLGSVRKLIHSYGYSIVKAKYTPIPIIEVLPKFLKKNLGYVLNFVLFVMSQVFRRVFSYQFIFIAEKS